MIVGIDVHKRSHAAALVDERGAPIATLAIPNSRAGVARFLRWFAKWQRASVSPKGAQAFLRAMAEVDVRPVLPLVQTPTLILHGAVMDPDAAALRLVGGDEARNMTDEGRFAGARSADQRHHLALGDGEVDVLYRRNDAAAGGELHRQVAHVEQRDRGHNCAL